VTPVRALLLALGLAVLAAAPAQGACIPPSAYPGDAAPKARIASWMADGAIAAGLPGELPVMGALVASDVQNLAHGDADEAGYFRMRTGVWDQGAYAGFPSDPVKQLRWFTDQARVRRSGGAAESTWGEWVPDVLRPAAQEACTLTATGTVMLSGARRRLSLLPATHRVAAGATAHLRLEAGPALLRATREARRRGRPVRATIAVTAVDAAGNRTRATRTVSWT
jgi:hypothetical protein